MIRFLIKRCIKNYDHPELTEVRTAYGKLAGFLGIVSNLLLFLLKLLAGILGNSVAIMSDAFNNLSDMGSSVVSLIGTTASGRHADEEHPFGHGRVEYVATLIVSFIIILVGFELMKASFSKIFHYEPLVFHPLALGVLIFSILAKLWLFVSNRYIGRKIRSTVIEAAAQDSLNDVFATAGVLLATVLGLVIEFPVDGIMGVLISILIMFTGYGIARDTITVLLGTSPDPAMADAICRLVMEQEDVVGVHDLIIHDYGPGRCMASVHAEVPEDGDIIKVHEMIDATERRIQEEMGVHIVIHMDPVSVCNERIAGVRETVLACVKQVNGEFDIHDFRMTDGEHNINLIFDLEVPYSMKPAEREQAAALICEKLKACDDRYRAVIQVENRSWQAKKQ